ncbi:nucleotidyltransferase family protein [Roseateles paludis]|uniref:Nucleotidyltransferase family protein n=1 Tax=Roseateles paludis TaxID=3145238 RepID=A0ABV0G1V0_9BURK
MNALATSLQRTTERLALELRSASSTAPDWTLLDWRVAMAMAFVHGISGLLAQRLVWRGPAEWHEFLTSQDGHCQAREAQVRAKLAALDAAARAHGLPVLALKGAALLELRVHAPGERPMGDIDLLCTPGDVEALDALVQPLGFVPEATSWKHRHYRPLQALPEPHFAEHTDNPLKLDLHTRIHERLPVAEVDITAALWRPAGTGVLPYPSHAALMRHLLLHTAGNLCTRSVRLIQLIDIARLAPRLTRAEWDEALAPDNTGAAAWWAWPVLALAQRYQPGLEDAIASPALDAARRACPVLLRQQAAHETLGQASLSRLSVVALPGLAWCRTPRELWLCARERLAPPRRERAVTQALVAAQPALRGSAWTQQSRWRKALDVVRGQAPRAQTLYAVHRALDYQPEASR